MSPHFKAVVCIATMALSALVVASPPDDPFVFWRASVVVTDADRRQLDRGEPLARILPGHGKEIAVFAALPANVDGDRLVAWVRQIADLKKSAYVQAIARFSDPPRLEDLAGLTLDDRDLTAIPQCEPGACGLKLASSEMEELRSAVTASGEDWKPGLQAAVRRLVLQRVEAYLAGGHAALPGYENTSTPISLADRFSTLLEHSTFLTKQLPQFAEALARSPMVPISGVESFVYWSKESFNGKPIVRATHVSILRGTGADLPDALVVGKEIFATHYLNASLGVTAIVRGEPGLPSYLLYLNRSDVDLVRGPFAGLVRWIIEGRLKSEAASVLSGLRQRLESGEPPSAEVSLSP
jgi:hypothetical protein